MNPAKEAAKIIDNIVIDSGRTECAYYHQEIFARSQDATVQDDIRHNLSPVAQVASYHFRRENTHDPFGPMFQSGDGRSAIPADLDNEDLTRLQAICAHLTTPELVARIQDVLWLRNRKPEFAENAIAAYIKCAELFFDLEHWVFCAECMERAMRLASLFRRQKPELCQGVADILLNWIDEYAETDQKFLTARAIRLASQFGYGNATDLYEVASKIANIAEKAGNFHRAEEYWKLAVQCARKAREDDSVNTAQSALAECYVTNARTHKGSAMLAAHWMQQAVEAYKAVPGSKEIRDGLYTELLEYQKASLSEMGQFEYKLDISDIVKATTEMLEGKNAHEAIFILAFGLGAPPNYSRLEKVASELAQKSPLSSIFSTEHLDREGMVVAKSEGSFGNLSSPSPREVYHQASLEHQLFVTGRILPAIGIILNEHYITEDDFLSIVINNSFVAPGQERLYSKGLFAGLTQDYVVAASILIPLLENSLRHVLKSTGVRNSTLKSDGTQEFLRIGTLLDHKKTTEIFGDDVVRDLRGLLIDRTYGNLRNVILHGLTTYETFQQPSVVYLWWLILRLCLTPHDREMAIDQKGRED